MNIAQPRPQALQNNRQLPQLPMPLRQLPQIDHTNATKPYFDTDETENEDLMDSKGFTRAGELFYYQTSSSSNSNASSVSGNFDRVIPQEQFRIDLQGHDDDDDDDADDDQRQLEHDENDQRLRSYEDDDDNEASPYEYES